MKPEKVWAALERYDRELLSLGIEARQFTPDEYDLKDGFFIRSLAAAGFAPTASTPKPGGLLPGRVLAHCRWMVRHCLDVFRVEYETEWSRVEGMTRESQHPRVMIDRAVAARAPLEKAMRWLCYIQGACNAIGVYSCNELRDHSRGEGEFKTASEEHGTPVVLDVNLGYVPPVRSVLKPRRTVLVETDAGPVVRDNHGFGHVEEPGVIAAGGPPPAGMVSKTPPTPAQLKAADRKLGLSHGAETMVEVAADILDLSPVDREAAMRKVALKKAVETPDDRRSVAQVELLKRSVYGCCNRHADNMGCDCVSQAEANEREGRAT